MKPIEEKRVEIPEPEWLESEVDNDPESRERFIREIQEHDARRVMEYYKQTIDKMYCAYNKPQRFHDTNNPVKSKKIFHVNLAKELTNILGGIEIRENKLRFLDAISNISISTFPSAMSIDSKEKKSYDAIIMDEIRNQKATISFTNFDIPKSAVRAPSDISTDNSRASKQNKLIRWTGKDNLLPYLFELLFENHLIAKDTFENRYRIMVDSFCKDDFTRFVAKNLQTGYNKTKDNKSTGGMPKGYDKLDSVINDIGGQ